MRLTLCFPRVLLLYYFWKTSVQESTTSTRQMEVPLAFIKSSICNFILDLGAELLPTALASTAGLFFALRASLSFFLWVPLFWEAPSSNVSSRERLSELSSPPRYTYL